MPSGKKVEVGNNRFGIDPRSFIGQEIDGYVLDRYVGHGKIGMVFHAVKKDIRDEAACKIIPTQNLRPGWKTELRKLVKLVGVPQVVQYKNHGSVNLQSEKGEIPYVYILYQFVKGKNLKEHCEANPNLVTLSFIFNVVVQTLHVFQALKATGITHGDLHEGNIMVADPDPRFVGHATRIMITDFGIGGSNKRIDPSDDYLQLSLICSSLVGKYVDPSLLEGEERHFNDRFCTDFLGKQLIERDETVGDYVRNPEKLLENLTKAKENTKSAIGKMKLRRPFDYLSCEQIGDSFDLLQKLYSRNFPGYQDLTDRMNTILTGPRGCGKTTIFRNLSLKTQLLGKKNVEKGSQFVGIYYHCRDLYFAFPYRLSNLEEATQRIITHYFNLALLYEVLETLAVAEENNLEIPPQALDRLQGFLQGWFTTYSAPPAGTSVLRHLLSLAAKDKQSLRAWIDENGLGALPTAPLMPQDFLTRLCDILQESIPWLKQTPFFFFLDDYSTPRISEEVQATVNNFIFARYSRLFFKVSTESLFTFHPCDATGKLLDITRDYDVVDLGDYFFNAQPGNREHFLKEVVNNRLVMAEDSVLEVRDICKILQQSSYRSYNELARNIRKPGTHVMYSGWGTVVDLCSGDIAHILRLIRDMFNLMESEPKKVLIPHESQDKAIREAGNELLNRIEAAPDTGRQLRKIAQAFGNVANHYLKTRISKNQKSFPPLQAFRIEVRETPYFEEDEKQSKLKGVPLSKKAEKYYRDLIRYGVFIRDVRGKSQRGAVVPRLYLRRLLIPTFVLTPSSRDSIGLEVYEFMKLLLDPKEFERHMKSKPSRTPKDLRGKQERLFK